jgi:TP901-1 family phage major tail protein
VTIAGLRAQKARLQRRGRRHHRCGIGGRWRELLGGAGVQRAALSGGGLFKDQASDALTRSVFFASEIRDWQVAIPDFGTVTGPFQITALEYAGRHDGEMTFEIAMESAGQLSFAAL